jgi:hypothetical protein
MLTQRIAQLRRAGLYDGPVKPVNGRESLPDSEAEPHDLSRSAKKGNDGTVGNPTFTVLVIIVALTLLGLIVALATVFRWSDTIVVVAAALVPNAAVLIGLLMANNRERRRQGAETGARLYRELCALEGDPEPFPRDAALALRRAENLVDQANLEIRLLTQRLLRNIALFCVLVIPAITVATFQAFDEARVQAIALGVIFEALMAVVFGTSRQRVRTLESDLREGDHERSLLTDNDNAEAQAEKLFLKHQFELKRYYDETLRQSAMLSYIGVLCMSGGFVVIGVAFYLIASADQPDTQQIVIATLAAAGGVLANFVAVLYLAMHARTVKALTGFHQRLVGTHHIHFGNLLASRVEDDYSSKVLAEMAIALAAEGGEQASNRSKVAGDSGRRGWWTARPSSS